MKRKPFSFLWMLGLCLTMLAAGTAQAGVIPSGISDSYRSGSYYDRLVSALYASPNASQPERLAAIALSQKGYNSGPVKNNYTGDGEAGSSGGKTYNEYSRWCGANGLDWCASFVSWCAYMAGIPTSIIPKSAGAGTYRGCGTRHIIWSSDFSTYIDYQPKKGDLMLAMPYKLVNGEYAHYNSYEKTAHVAIVAEDATERDGKGGWMFRTIERRGNTVDQRYMSTQIRAGGESAPGTHYVQMFVTPDYRADRTPPTNCSLSIYSPDYRPGSPVTLTPTGSNVSYYLLTVRDAANTGTIYYSSPEFTGPVRFTPTANGKYVVWVNALSSSGGMAKFHGSFEICDHTHAWGAGTVTTAPTCSWTGVRTYTCSICGEKKTETLPMLTTHSWNAGVVTRAATCSAEGLRTYTCRNNSSHVRTEVIPKTGHRAGAAVQENRRVSTCAAAGSYDEVVYCTVCGAQISRKTVALPKLSHKWNYGKVTKAPTASTTGVRSYTCKSCKKVRTEVIPKLRSDDQTVPIGQAPGVNTVEKKILKMTGDEAPGNARFNLLQLKTGKVTSRSVQLKWKKVKGATGYIVYGARCGQKSRRLKILNSGSRTSWTHSNLQKGKYYKYFVLATAKKGSERRVIATAKMVHVITKGGSTGNYKSVKLLSYKSKTAVIKVGKMIHLKAKAVPSGSKVKVKSHRSVRFESTNQSVAVVGEKSGRVRGKKAGKCYIYVYAQNGVCQRVRIIVKK